VHDLDRRIIDHARNRHGLITTREAFALGATRTMLRSRVAKGLLVPAEREVLQVAGAPATWESRLLAAVLAAGPGAAASHRSAAALWGFEGFGQGVPEITVPRDRRHKRADVRVHQSTDLDRCSIRTRRGVPVTDPAAPCSTSPAGRGTPGS